MKDEETTKVLDMTIIYWSGQGRMAASTEVLQQTTGEILGKAPHIEVLYQASAMKEKSPMEEILCLQAVLMGTGIV